MPDLHPASELWSDTEPHKPCLIMGNSLSLEFYGADVYDRFFTLGCNSRMHGIYVPDITLMVDRELPEPTDPDCALASHVHRWKTEHPGTVYTYELGRKLEFHPDPSTTKIDYASTSAYMAIVFAYHMGYRTFSFIGIDLGAVDNSDRVDMARDKGLTQQRKRFFHGAYNHLTHLINKMARYHQCRFFSLSPHSQLLMNGNVQKAEFSHGGIH